MKGIVLELKDISDSREVMESKETPGISRFIYILLIMLLCAVLFACLFEIDDYSRVSGEIKTQDATSNVVPAYTCKIKEILVSEGQLVKSGDVLFKLDSDYAKEQQNVIKEKISEYESAMVNVELLKKSINDDKNYFKNNDEDANYYYRYEQYKNGVLISLNELSSSQLSSNLTIEDKKNNLKTINDTINSKNSELTEMKNLLGCVQNNNDYSSYNDVLNASYTEYRTGYDKALLLLEQYKKSYEDVVNKFNSQGQTDNITPIDVETAKSEMEKAYTDMINYRAAYISDIRAQILIIESQMSQEENAELQSLLDAYVSLKSAVESNQDYISSDQTTQNSYDEYIKKYNDMSTIYDEKSDAYYDIYNKYSLQNSNIITETDLNNAENAYKSASLDADNKKNNYISQLQSSISKLGEEIKTLENNKHSLELSIKSVDTYDDYEKLSEDKLKNEAIIAINSEIEMIKENISSAQMQLMEINNTIKSSEITASHDGRITLIGDYHAGDYVQAGSSLCSLVPQTDELKVVLYIPEKEISKIEIGQKTEYIFDALPYTEYGKITGEILSVSEDSIINESAQTRFYIAKASISKQVLENNKGEKREVKTGMLVQAKTISGSKKAIVWLMEKLNFMD
ncbi:MAG: HlyD family efflux transporter periplasmic adaptor subunit [Ruminococcus sp.]|nr:HlyD family efflux transporter periplasmic adaptor subunit [Ruminococcus sp.]